MKDKFEGFCALLFGTLIGFFLGCFIGIPTVFSVIGMFISFGIREHYKNKIDEMKWAVRSSKNIIL